MARLGNVFWKLPVLGRLSRIAIDPPAPVPGRGGLAIAAVVRDEARHIGEWAAFHHRAGVSRFVIYDDGSTDGTVQILLSAVPKAAVEVVAWHQRFRDSALNREIHNQVLAYAHAVRNYGGDMRWMAFIDVDEFLIPKRAGTVPEALESLEACRCLSLPWHMFGRSGHETPPEGGVLRNYRLRLDDPTSSARGAGGFKCVVDPCHVTSVGVHFVGTDGGDRTCNDRGETFRARERAGREFYSADNLQLNHYYTRSAAELRDKIARGPNLSDKRGAYERKVMRTVRAIEASQIEDRAAADYLDRIGWTWDPCAAN